MWRVIDCWQRAIINIRRVSSQGLGLKRFSRYCVSGWGMMLGSKGHINRELQLDTGCHWRVTVTCQLRSSADAGVHAKGALSHSSRGITLAVVRQSSILIVAGRRGRIGTCLLIILTGGQRFHVCFMFHRQMCNHLWCVGERHSNALLTWHKTSELGYLVNWVCVKVWSLLM